jgi:aromatic-L-amino-acid decarboxylase
MHDGSFPSSLDPEDWDSTRVQAHRMLDDILTYIQDIRSRPVWKPAPAEIRAKFDVPLPRTGSELGVLHAEFMQDILPFAVGNTHPAFMGWAHGGGNVPGMLAEILAAGLNANCGGRNQIPIEVERQVTQWVRALFGFPPTASGIFVTGTSMANLLAILVARRTKLGPEVRTDGLGATGGRLRGYTSRAAHGCLRQAFDLAGLGAAALRLVETDDHHRMRLDDLQRQIDDDLAAGYTPFLVAGSAGTVDVGAVDPLDELAALCRAKNLWFHVDGAFGALGILAPSVAPLLKGIERADSLAFDFHKWGQVPYDAGFLLVRDGDEHLQTFASSDVYLRRETRGLAANSPWPCDYGPDLSRGFKALKTWFTLKAFGTDQLGEMIDKTCFLARYLEARINSEPELELLAGATLNIVCFRYRGPNPDPLNAEIVADLHESGIAVPSVTSIGGNIAIRAAIMNHRTEIPDIEALLAATLDFGRRRAGAMDFEMKAGLV